MQSVETSRWVVSALWLMAENSVVISDEVSIPWPQSSFPGCLDHLVSSKGTGKLSKPDFVNGELKTSNRKWEVGF